MRVVRGWDGRGRREDLVVRALHEGRFEIEAERDVRVGVRLGRDELQFGVKLRDAVLDQEPQEVQAREQRLSWGRGNHAGAVRVVRPELVKVALRSGVVLLRHREERGVLEDLARERELVRRGRGLFEEGRERGERGDRHLRWVNWTRGSDLGSMDAGGRTGVKTDLFF